MVKQPTDWNEKKKKIVQLVRYARSSTSRRQATESRDRKLRNL